MANLNETAHALLNSKTASKGEKRKVDIILATIKSINDLGIEKTTFESIGKYIGIHKAHVAYHFKKKDDLILAAIELITLHSQALVISRLEKYKNSKQRLFHYVDAHQFWVEKYTDHVTVFLLFFHLSTYRREFKVMGQNIKQAGWERIKGLVKEHQSDLKPSEVKLIATSIQQMIQSAVIDSVSVEQKTSLVFPQLKKQIKRLFH